MEVSTVVGSKAECLCKEAGILYLVKLSTGSQILLFLLGAYIVTCSGTGSMAIAFARSC